MLKARRAVATTRSPQREDPTREERAAIAEAFDAAFYLQRNPDIAAAGVDPLDHFLSLGWKEGRDPRADFSVSSYLSANPDVAAAGVNPFGHFLLHGRAEGRPLAAHAETADSQARALIAAAFDAAFYRAVNADLPQDADPLDHFLSEGAKRGYDPSPDFSVADYLADHPDVAASGENPFVHYHRHGLAEGRRALPSLQRPPAAMGGLSYEAVRSHFDAAYYLDRYADVAASGLDPLGHYLDIGWREGRDPAPWFNTRHYLRANPDVVASEINPFEHYLRFGVHENRSPSGPPRPSWALNHGTIVFVTHDAGVGGAPYVLRTLAAWFRDRTRFDVRVVALEGGAVEHDFRQSFAFLNLHGLSGPEAEAAIADFVGEDVTCVVVNSVASARFLEHWRRDDVPIIAFIHELYTMIELFADGFALLRERAQAFVAASGRVRDALVQGYAIPAERVRLIYAFLPEVDRAPPEGAKTDARARIGAAEEAFVAMACGVAHWRKAPKRFVEVAALVAPRLSRPVEFIWVGGGEDQAACEALAAELGVGDVVRFTGYRRDASEILLGADVFLLPSEEDPFPLVCLEAALGETPIVCFREAGGMPELVEGGAGVVAPFGDVQAMAEAVALYAEDEPLRRAHGREARARVIARHSDAVGGRAFLELIREVTGVRPAVSVVVPNFNYARFLPQRLDSIDRQTLQDFEVLLLDDASSDASLPLLRGWAATRANARLICNDVNSGSPFIQWLKGIDQARARLIWLAEADDFCEPNFLENLIPAFDDPNVMFGFGKSIPVDAAGRVSGDYERMYLNRIAQDRWSRAYRASDHEEVNAALAVGNSVPNASAVMFRRFDAEKDFRALVSGMRMCGDWLFYIRAIRAGLVAFEPGALNYHRRHGDTVTHQTEGSRRYFDELRDIRRFISAHYRVSPQAREQAERFTKEDIARFGVSDANDAAAIFEEARYRERPKAKPSVAFVTSDLGPGGGQMFTIRLANAWTAAGGRAVLIDAHAYPPHPAVVAKIDPRVARFDARAPGFALEDLLARFDIDVVHSSIWWADRFVFEALQRAPRDVRWVVTMHGCYETLLERPETDPGFEALLPQMLARVDHWAYLSEKNTQAFARFGEPRAKSRIVNGYAPEPLTPGWRDRLKLRPGALVVSLVSRAIEAKGWRQAVAAVEALNAEGVAVELLLVGEGPEADRLRASGTPPGVHALGHVSDVHNVLDLSDVGLLPSYFVGESMPLVLIEMLAQGKPVVATKIGEIEWMLRSPEGVAGRLLEVRNGSVSPAHIRDALRQLAQNPELRATLGARARAQYERHFTMQAMVAAYERVYRDRA